MVARNVCFGVQTCTSPQLPRVNGHRHVRNQGRCFATSPTVGEEAISPVDILSGAPSVPVVPGAEIISANAPDAGSKLGSQGLDAMLEELQATKTSLPQSSTVPSLEAASEATRDLTNTAAEAAEKASAAAAEVAGAAADTASQLSEQLGGAVTYAQSFLSGAQTEFNTTVNNIQENVGSAYAGVQATVVDTASSLTSAGQEQLDAVLNQLPPGAREALQAASSAAVDAAQAAVAHPAAGGVAAVLGVGVPAVVAYNAAFGGYAGSLSPSNALEMLQTTDAVLVDVRLESSRLKQGVPELKRSARGKGIVLLPVTIPPSVSRQVRNSNDLALQILGTEIAFLARIGPGTRIIVMDERGAIAKAVARAATAAGVRRAYSLSGGFSAWQKDKLPTTSGNYDSSPLAAVGDVAEVVAEEAVAALKSPKNAAFFACGSVLAVAAAVNYHLLLRYIAVFGLEATLVLKLLEYDSPQALMEDISSTVARVAGALQGPATAVYSGMIATEAAGQISTSENDAVTLAVPSEGKVVADAEVPMEGMKEEGAT